MALAVSAAGFGVSVWATQISKRSFKLATKIKEESDAREFDRVRADLLDQIPDSRAVLDRARIEIGTLEADFRVEAPALQKLMAGYTGLFSEYLPKIEASIRQCDDLWREVSQWDSEKSHAELMVARAVLHRSFQDEKIAHETAIYLVNRFTAKLEAARNRVAALPKPLNSIDEAG